MELVSLEQFANDAEAELARGLLEANGISASIAGGVPCITPQGPVPSGAVLQVASTDLKRAAELLAKATKHRSESNADKIGDDKKNPSSRSAR